MPPLYNARGIILRKYDLGEADRLLTVYTQEHGKKRLVANGVRRPKSRLAGSLMLFTDSSLVIYAGKTLDRISQAEINNSFPPLREDLECMAYASYIAELVDKFVELEAPEPRLFGLLLYSLRLISQSGPSELTARTFELSLLDMLGYRPHLVDCVVCGSSLEGSKKVLLSIDMGGAVCGHCRSRAAQIFTISHGSFKALRKLQKEGLRVIEVLHPCNERILREIAGFNRRYIDYRLEKTLKSLAFLDTVVAKSQ